MCITLQCFCQSNFNMEFLFCKTYFALCLSFNSPLSVVSISKGQQKKSGWKLTGLLLILRHCLEKSYQMYTRFCLKSREQHPLEFQQNSTCTCTGVWKTACRCRTWTKDRGFYNKSSFTSKLLSKTDQIQSNPDPRNFFKPSRENRSSDCICMVRNRHIFTFDLTDWRENEQSICVQWMEWLFHSARASLDRLISHKWLMRWLVHWPRHKFTQ